MSETDNSWELKRFKDIAEHLAYYISIQSQEVAELVLRLLAGIYDGDRLKETYGFPKDEYIDMFLHYYLSEYLNYILHGPDGCNHEKGAEIILQTLNELNEQSKQSDKVFDDAERGVRPRL